MSSSVPASHCVFRCVGPGDSADVSVAGPGCSGEASAVLVVNLVVIEDVKVEVGMSTCQDEPKSGCRNLAKVFSDSIDESHAR